jgi:hypothetical protein
LAIFTAMRRASLRAIFGVRSRSSLISQSRCVV